MKTSEKVLKWVILAYTKWLFWFFKRRETLSIINDICWGIQKQKCWSSVWCQVYFYCWVCQLLPHSYREWSPSRDLTLTTNEPPSALIITIHPTCKNPGEEHGCPRVSTVRSLPCWSQDTLYIKQKQKPKKHCYCSLLSTDTQVSHLSLALSANGR